MIIPAFNEESRVGRVIESIPKDVVDEILVVDVHCTDSTVDESLRAGASVIRQSQRQGAGAAIKTGYREGLRRAGDILVVVAGDMQHDPADIPKLLRPIQRGKVDYVLGDRLSSGPLAHGMPPIRYIGNLLLTCLTRLATRVDVKDSQCGFTAINRTTLEGIDMNRLSDSWGITNCLLAECSRNHKSVAFVPVSTRYGARKSYIRLRTYIPCIVMILLGAFLRISRASHSLSETESNDAAEC